MINWFDQKRGWKKISIFSHNNLVSLFEQVIDEAKAIGVWDKKIDKVDYYLVDNTKAIASCNYHCYASKQCIDIGFTFNKKVALNFPNEKLLEIIIHEVAHACTIGHHHDATWEHTCRKIGKKWGYTNYFSRTEQDAEVNACMRLQRQEKAKFLVKCPACGASWFYQKATRCVNHPEGFRCGCGWKGLEVTTLS